MLFDGSKMQWGQEAGKGYIYELRKGLHGLLMQVSGKENFRFFPS